MLISDSTIQRVKDLDIVQVVSQYVPTLKSKGNKHEACCPFHDEKSPSFHLNSKLNIFKCFGCHAAGDGIAFVMKHENLSYPEAIKQLATDHSIEVELQEQDPEKAAAAQAEQLERETIRIVLDYAAAYYAFNKLPENWVKFRGLNVATLTDWQIGFAEDQFDHFTKAATEQKYSVESLMKAGLVKRKEIDGGEVRYYDAFRGRAMFPIRDQRGRLVAFTGRITEDPAPDAQYKPAKYLNSPDTAWNKGHHLYGLDRAGKAIRQREFAYLVEGHIDVVQWHQHGLTNTVGGIGTALTPEQIKLLQQYTERVVLVPDNDPAGLKAMHRNALLLIEAGLRVETLMPVEQCDPDDMVRRKLKTPEDIEAWLRTKKDYITGELLADCEREAVLSPHDRAEAAGRLGGVLELIKANANRQAYYDDLTQRWPDFKKLYKLVKRGDGTELKLLEQLKAETRAQLFDYGFFERDGCFYAYEKKAEVRICNFTFEIQYFVLSQNEPKYVVHFRNMFGTSRTMAVTTDDFTSVATFKKCVGRLGNFIFEGNDTQLNLLKIKYFHGVAEAVQPRTMLYNPSGDFTTFANGLYYEGKFFPADRYGMVKLERPVLTFEELTELRGESHIQIGEEVHVLQSAERLAMKLGQAVVDDAIEEKTLKHLAFYFLPFASTLKLTDDDDDDYETERRFKLPTKVTPIAFKDWGQLMRKAYGRNGYVMVAFYLAAVYRDLVYKANGNYFPLLHLYGLRGSGKSKAAESLVAAFGQFSEETAVRLEGGATATGIQRYMSTARNGLMMLDEYKNSLQMNIIGLLKGIANGTGKLMGRATGGNETKSLRPLSSAVVCGQDLPTRDPALLSRSLVLEFSEEIKRQNDREAYEQLKTLQESGAIVHVTSEMLKHRPAMLEYRKREPSITRSIREHCQEKLSIADPEDRTVQNAATLLTTTAILSDAGVELPFTQDELFEVLMERMQHVIEIQHTSDDVEQYFMVLGSLIGRDVLEGTHFKIWREEDGITKLFLRVRQVHPLYLQAAQRQGVEPLSAATVRGYLSKSRFFLEDRTKGVRFESENNPTSAMVFNYDMMREDGVELATKENIEKLEAKDDDSRKLTRKIHVNGNAQQLVQEWLDEQPEGTTLDVATALRSFNVNKEPVLSETAFIAHLEAYADGRNQHELTFNNDRTRLKLSQPF